MRPYTVSFFGHRKIYDIHRIENKLSSIISDILQEHENVEFLIGRQGEFDEYAASVIKRCLKSDRMCNGFLTWVLPYKVADIEYYNDYYDDIIIPECLSGVHPKAAASLKNRFMIDSSDLIIAFVEKSGGAYRALQHASKKEKTIINIATKEII